MLGGGTIRLSAALAALAALFCTAAGGKPGMERASTYTVLEAGTDAAFSERGPSLMLFTEEDEFDRFYAGLHVNRIPVPEPPAVDFNANVVAYISYGRKNTGGYSIDVLGVFVERDNLFIKTKLQQPLPDSFQIQVLTHPYAMLSIERGDFKSVNLIDERGERLDSKSVR
jgi:hypothetical protein